ncbi:MAG: trigger factor [Planctomycetaceae bacterium]
MEEQIGEALSAPTAPRKIDLKVEIQKTGPCKKRVKVGVPRAEIDRNLNTSIRELIATADVPGFRKGRVPRSLVEKRFRQEVGGQVLQRVLMQSLEQLAEEHNLDAINEPDLDIEDLVIPESGDFEFEFEVEVRPEFDLPDYSTLKIKRPVGQVSDADVTAFLNRRRRDLGATSKELPGPAEANDMVWCNIRTLVNGDEVGRRSRVLIVLRPEVDFNDARVLGLDKLLAGAVVGDIRETTCTISAEATTPELRGETGTVSFEVVEIRRREPAQDDKLLASMGCQSAAELEASARDVLQKQLEYRQRQAVREQVLHQIAATADWELPDNLVLRQVENALRREGLEMREAGYSDDQVESRLAQVRRNQITETRQALKQHFILDKLATVEQIECEPADKESEIVNIARQSGDSPRKVRSQLERRGLMENLEAQIRERKAVDFLLRKVSYEDVPDQVTAEENTWATRVPLAEVSLTPADDQADGAAE